jgi:hypothetical protein
LTVSEGIRSADAGVLSPEVSTCDLDADVRARMDAAKGLWGPDTHDEIVAGSFVIVAAGRKALLEQAASLAERALDALFHDQLRHRPNRGVTVALWSTEARYDA